MQLNKLQVNIIHAHGLPALIVSAVFKKIFKCGLIFDARELESKRNHRGLFMNSLLSFIEKYLINLCDSILVVSPSIKKFYETQFPKKNFYLLVNACSKREKQASLINIRDKFKIPNSSLIFMYIGALGRVRGIDLYLNVFKKLSEKHHLVLMGDGLLKEQIIDVSKTTKNIHYLPPVSWENVVGIAEDADYILRVAEVSSLSYKLALPNTFFQAMLARTPLIINEECIEMLNFYQEDEMLISTKYSESSLYQLIKNLKKRDYRNTKPLPSYLTWEFYESVLFYVYSNSLECKAAA